MKIIKVLLIILLFTGCEVSSCSDIFTLKSVKSVKGDDIEELEQEIDEYEDIINEKIDASNKLGLVYQKLGEKYLERRAWNPAIDALKKAIGYGNNRIITFYSLALAYSNKAMDVSDKESAEMSEYYYRKILKKAPDFYDASYGLGLLMFYVKEEKQQGLRIMQNLVLRKSTHYKARFALARFYYELGKLKKSLSVYEDLYADLDKAAGSPQITEFKNNSKLNIERLMREIARSK